MPDFDPYYKWLGIPPKEQPPDCYRLLGLEQFEGDPEVIEAAANRQMLYLQELASGLNIKHAQQLIDKVTQARIRLLDPQRKAAYDAKLRGGGGKQPVATSRRQARRGPARAVPLRKPASATAGPPVARVVPLAPQKHPAAAPQIVTTTNGSSSPSKPHTRKKNNTPILMAALLVVIIIIGGGVTLWAISSNGSASTSEKLAGSTSKKQHSVSKQEPATSEASGAVAKGRDDEQSQAGDADQTELRSQAPKPERIVQAEAALQQRDINLLIEHLDAYLADSPDANWKGHATDLRRQAKVALSRKNAADFLERMQTTHPGAREQIVEDKLSPELIERLPVSDPILQEVFCTTCRKHIENPTATGADAVALASDDPRKATTQQPPDTPNVDADEPKTTAGPQVEPAPKKPAEAEPEPEPEKVYTDPVELLTSQGLTEAGGAWVLAADESKLQGYVKSVPPKGKSVRAARKALATLEAKVNSLDVKVNQTNVYLDQVRKQEAKTPPQQARKKAIIEVTEKQLTQMKAALEEGNAKVTKQAAELSNTEKQLEDELTTALELADKLDAEYQSLKEYEIVQAAVRARQLRVGSPEIIKRIRILVKTTKSSLEPKGK